MLPKTTPLSNNAIGRTRALVCRAGLAAALACSLMASPALATDIGWNPDVPNIDTGSSSEETPSGGGDTTGGGSSSDTTVNEVPSVDSTTTPSEPPVSSGGDTTTTTTTTTPTTSTPSTTTPAPALPDSSSSGNDYGNYYSGGASASTAGAASDSAYSGTAPTEVTPEPVAEETQTASVDAAATLAISRFDASSAAVTGTAPAGQWIRLLDGDGNVLGETWAGEDGTFTLYLPEGYDLSWVQIVALDEYGNWTGDPLSGATVAAELAAADLASAKTEAASTAAELARELIGSMANLPDMRSFEVEQASFPLSLSALTSLPLSTPVVIGAGAAVVLIAVGGGVYAFVRSRRNDETDETGQLTASVEPVPELVPLGETSGSMTPVAGADQPVVTLFGSAAPGDTFAFVTSGAATGAVESTAAFMVAVPATSSSAPEPVADDELELLALSLSSREPDDGGDEPDDDPTPPDGPNGGGPAPEDRGATDPGETASFIALANPAPATVPQDRAGAVPQRVQNVIPFASRATAAPTPSSKGSASAAEAGCEPDFSGLDVFKTGSFSAAPIVSGHTGALAQPSPASADQDWLALALSELAHPASSTPGRPSSTDDYIRVVTTKPGPALATSFAVQATGCAPVVGPNTVSSQSARERQERARAAATPNARAVLDRDAQFQAERGPVTKELAIAAARSAYAAFGPYSAVPIAAGHQHTAVPHPNLRVVSQGSGSGQTIPFAPVKRGDDRISRPA